MRLGLEAGESTIDLAVKYNVGGVPISAADLVAAGPEKACERLRKSGLLVCQIGAFGYNPLVPDTAALASQRKTVLECIPLARQTGCRYIVISGGSYHPNAFGGVDARNFAPAAIDAVAREIEPVLRAAADHDAIISIEPYLKTAVGSPDAFLRLERLCGSHHLRVNLDVTSLYDFAALVDPGPSMKETCEKLAPYIGLVHVKEVALVEGFHIHAGLAPLSEGRTDWKTMFEMVGNQIPEDSWVVLEHVQSENEAKESLARLRHDIDAAGFSWR